MRIPILATDLPDRFNKVAKYIGRHWPTGKLGLNHAREHLAYMFGYNSVHELNKVADITELPSQISTDDAHASMLGKALFKYGVHPNKLSTVLDRAPFKELSFYTVTGIAKAEAYSKEQTARNFAPIVDEMQALNNYKSPDLIIQQNNDGLLPPYKYAVRSDGKIFCASYYESLINRLGDINKTVDEIGGDLTVHEFINKYVLPFSWINLKEYLETRKVDGEYNWRAPFMVDVYHARVDNKLIGYVLYHSGLNAYYPAVFESNGEVINALASIYQKQVISPDLKFPNSAIETSLTFNSTLCEFADWTEESFDEAESFEFEDQLFIRANPFIPYTQLDTCPVLSRKHLQPEELANIAHQVIDEDVYHNHVAIGNFIDNVLNNAIEKISCHQDSENIIFVFNKLFGKYRVVLEDILAFEHGDDYKASTEDMDSWAAIGKQVFTHHPELEPFFDVRAAGRCFIDYQVYVNDYRMACSCEQRNIGFIGYSLSFSPLLRNRKCRHETKALAGVLVISSASSGRPEHQNLEECYEKNITMLSDYYRQERKIRYLEKYANHIEYRDYKYVTHGEPASYRERSYSEAMREATRTSRNLGSAAMMTLQVAHFR